MEKIDRERLFGVQTPSEYDNATSKYVFRPLSRIFSMILLRTPATPNQITIFWGLLMIASAALLFTGDRLLCVIGGLGWIVAYALDYSDGDIARYKDMRSVRGRFQDRVNHRTTYPILMFGAGFGAWVSGRTELFGITIDPAAYLILGFTAGLGMILIIDLGANYNNCCPDKALDRDKGTAAVEGKHFKNQRLFKVLMILNPLVFTNMMVLTPVFALLDMMDIYVLFYGVMYPLAAFARYVLLYRMVPGVPKK
ncbi:MAG: CDP-alcohol phosphatidyltransferase family protein [Candidatus Methanomethylophilaceae archaeon]|nr:CDP-alcohol phosphatidyltransferase family protein [Candidatus Methanomethylophilaceae archaeon]